jgi:hypothetical protein
MGEFTFCIFFHSCRLLHFLSCIRELQKKNFINSPSRNRPGRLGVLNRKKPPTGSQRGGKTVRVKHKTKTKTKTIATTTKLESQTK